MGDGNLDVLTKMPVNPDYRFPPFRQYIHPLPGKVRDAGSFVNGLFCREPSGEELNTVFSISIQ